jgi:hypothetical protein
LKRRELQLIWNFDSDRPAASHALKPAHKLGALLPRLRVRLTLPVRAGPNLDRWPAPPPSPLFRFDLPLVAKAPAVRLWNVSRRRPLAICLCLFVAWALIRFVVAFLATAISLLVLGRLTL